MPDPPEATPTPPARKGERTRQRILDAAARVFATRPASSVTMEEIATAAEVSVGTLYTYFASRDALLLAYTSDGYAILDAYRAEVRTSESPLQRVYTDGDAYLRFTTDHPWFGRFMLLRGLQPSDDPTLEEANARVAAKTQELVMQTAVDLQGAMQAGELPPAPIDEMIVMLFGLWNGITDLVLRDDESAIPEELAWRAVERSRVILHRAIAHEFDEQAAT